MNFNYYIPTKILFGKGTLNTLHKQKLPGKKALIVISNGKSVKENGYLDRLLNELKLANIDFVIFDKIQPNPVKSHVMEGAALGKNNGCDFIIGLGGGSPIDSAKSIAIMATNDGDYWDYIPSGSGKGKEIKNNPLPVVAITTTAGTGTEADPWTVITHEEKNEKIGFGCETTFPVLSIVDPDLMMTVPPHLTAFQGFDALFHSTEGYIANIANPISDLFAIKAIELIGKSLPTAIKDGKNEKARTDIALANTLSGLVESTSSCISEHSIEHALSAYHPTLPHGAGLIIISKAYYEFFAENHANDVKMIDMAKALGKNDATTAMDFVHALYDLQKKCGVDELKMSDYGIDKSNLLKYAKNAKETMGGLFKLDPVPLSEADCVKILMKSYR